MVYSYLVNCLNAYSIKKKIVQINKRNLEFVGHRPQYSKKVNAICYEAIEEISFIYLAQPKIDYINELYNTYQNLYDNYVMYDPEGIGKGTWKDILLMLEKYYL